MQQGQLMRAGVCSVTFRKKAPAEVVALSKAAGLDGIEWGGDVHVPPGGEPGRAREVAARTRDAGLAVSSYGSYLRLGQAAPGKAADDEHRAVIDTAVALGAPVVRVWAGTKGSRQATPEERAAVVAAGKALAARAADAGVRIATEWHGGTLTDTRPAALELLRSVGRPEVFGTYWQPRTKQPVPSFVDDLPQVAPHLLGVHVFQWDAVTGARLALSEGQAFWPGWLSAARDAARANRRPIYALLEFVKGDDPDAFRADAATLLAWRQALPEK